MKNERCIFSYIYTLGLTLCFFQLFSQPISDEKPFNQITNETGRSLGFITGISQDSAGFLWLASRSGLFKYDGYSFVSYRKSLQNPTGIPFSDITLMYRDLDNNLWVRHFDQLYLLEKEKLSFRYDTLFNKRFNHNTQIVQDREKNYWIGPHNHYLFRFNPSTGDIDTLLIEPNIWPQKIIEAAQKKSPKTYQLKILPDRHNVDTTHTFNIDRTRNFLIITAGEGNKYKFFDYGTLKTNGKILWQPDCSKVVFDRNSSLFYASYDIITLTPGSYTLTYCNDDANTFIPSAVNPALLPFYGIVLLEITDPKALKSNLQNPVLPPNRIQGDLIYSLTLGNNQYPIVSTNKGIFEYSQETNLFQNIFPIEIPSSIQNQITIPVIQTNDHRLVFAVRDTVFILTEKQIKKIALTASNTMTMSLLVDSDNYLWIGTNNGIFIGDLNEKDPKIIQHITTTLSNRLYSNFIWSLYEDRSKNIWIGTDKGLNQFVKSKFQILNLDNERFSPQPMVIDPLNNIYLLTKKGFWTAVGERTIVKKTISPRYFTYLDLTKEHIFDFHDLIFDEEKNRIYFTTGAMVGIMDLSANVEKTFLFPPLEIKATNIATKMVRLGNEIAVAGIDRILFFDPQLIVRGEVIYPQSPEAAYDVNKTLIKDFISLTDNLVALRTEYAVYLIDAAKKSLVFEFQVPFEVTGTSVTNGNLAKAPDNSLWFGLLPNIYKLTSDGNIRTFVLESDEDLGEAKISFENNTMFLATNNGFFLFENYKLLEDLKSDTIPHNQYSYFSTLDGLADNRITDAIPTQSGEIWLTTLKGLSLLDPKTRLVKNYFREDDYLSLGFPGKYLCKQKNEYKTCILQTTNGLLIFKPDSVNPYKPNIVVTEIALFGKPFQTDSLTWEKKFLKLKYNQNFLTFTFSSLDFTQPAMNRYRYRMINFNNQWTYTDANNRKAPFTGIPPGKYIFVVEGTNNDGVWNETGCRIIIEITPPWYKTTLAYILYIVITVLGILFFIKWRERKLIQEKRVLEAMVRARTAEIMKQKEEIQAQRDKIAEQNKNITDSINYASRIQAALLPQKEMLDKYLCSYFVLWRPRDIVSGDFFWMTHHGDISIAVAADCTGHGVPGAFMSMLGIAFLNDIVNKEKIFETDKILNELRNNIMIALKQTGEEGGSKDGMDISMCAINHRRLKAKFSGAYNPLLIVRGEECLEFKADKMPIGYHIKKDQQFSQHNIDLQIGDRLYMFSDGYVDQFGGHDGRKFMSKRFKEILVESRHLPMPDQKVFLNQTIEEWMGHHEQIDDILVFGIEITENAVYQDITESYYPEKNVNDM